MYDYKTILGLIAVIIAFLGYIPYFWNIFRNQAKPHAFSWFVWAVLTSIAFAAQVVEQGGAAAWVTGFTAFVCLIISFLALYKGVRSFPLFDWMCLLAAGIAILLWGFTKNPTISIVLITITDAIAFMPTFRKAYYKPQLETASTFALNALKFFISLFALESITLSTWLYPASLVLMNGTFVIMLLVRRKV